jgi:G3E family GTPase
VLQKGDSTAVTTERKVPVNLVCGPLGIGKTTAIIQYLRRTSASQFTAVLVNDFGPVGLDAAIMEGDLQSDVKGNTAIKMLPGGCVCCTSAAGFLASMGQLQQLPRLDRIIIEPSGLAMVGDMVDVVASVAKQYHLELRPVITLVEPRLLDRAGFTQAPYYIRMVEAADVLVANRCDLATPEQIARFEQWSAGLYPSKLRVILTRNGEIADEVFDLRHDTERVRTAAGAKLPHDADQHAGGCTFGSEVVFQTDAIERLLQEFAMKGFAGNEVLRLKAILHTQEGWRLYEIARGQSHIRPTDYRRDSRIDWITEGIPLLDEAVKARFEACLAE